MSHILVSQDRLRYARIPESWCGFGVGIGVGFEIAGSSPVRMHTGDGKRNGLV